VSVVLPIDDDRGQLEAALRAWLGQTYPREQFELIVPTDGTRPDLDRLARLLLGTAGRILSVPGALNERQLFDAGARAARAPLIILAEAHSIPATDFLEEMTRYLAETGLQAAEATSIPIDGNMLEELEAESFAAGRQHPWNTFVVHGFAIRREAYIAAGGFAAHLGNFASPAFAAALHALGIEAGHAERARILHRYRHDPGAVEEHIREHAWGELDFRRGRGDDDYCCRYFGGRVAEWETRGNVHPAAGRALAGALFRLAREDLRRARVRSCVMTSTMGLKWAARALFGLRLQAGAAAVQLAALRFWLVHGPGSRAVLSRAYASFWATALHRARLDYVAGVLRRDDAPALGPGCTALAEADGGALAGFYPAEQCDGIAFRWSEPAAAVRLAVPPDGPCRVSITLLNVRADSPPVHIAFGGRPPVTVSAEPEGGRCVLRLLAPVPQKREREAVLTIVTHPLPCHPRSRERRKLGLPIERIAVERIAGH
jgi:hypothetical protein